jgi:WD40 repeat protein
MKAYGGNKALIVAATLLITALACMSAGTAAPATEPTLPPLPTEPPAPPEDAFIPEVVWRVAFEQEQGLNTIHSLAFSPDGRLVAVGVHPEARLYNAADGELALAIEYRNTVNSLGFSPDGSILGSGLTTYGVQLTRITDGEEAHVLGDGFDSVVAFSSDGETIATGNREGTIWLWRVADGELLASFERPVEGAITDHFMTDITFSPDGSLLASAHFDGSIHVWQIPSGSLLHTLMPPTDFERADSIAFSPDGKLLAASGAQEDWNNVARLWQVSDGTPAHVLGGHVNVVTSLAFSADGTLFASGGSTRDGTVKLWQTSDWLMLNSLEHLDDQNEVDRITSIDFSPDGRYMAVGTWSGLIWLWQVQP